MSRVITFSRTFPSYHPKAGEKTFFAEKVMAAFAELPGWGGKIPDEFTDWDWYEYYNGACKNHTIRAGNRWKVGDKFSPRIWTGKPYQSKQQVLWSHDIEIKKIWDIEVLGLTWLLDGKPINNLTIQEIAKNDGLTYDELKQWFSKLPFRGQVICWNSSINYETI